MPTPTAQDYFNATRTFLEDMATLEETPGPGTGGRRQILNSSAALRRIFVENLLGRANSKAGLKFTFEARKCHEPKTVMPPDHVLKVAKMTYDEYIGSITYFQAEALDPPNPTTPTGRRRR